MSPAHLDRYKATKASEDLPGLGKHYCVACSRWLENQHALDCHKRGKPHKRRLKQLADGVYTQREAEAAVGKHTDNSAQTKIFFKPLAVGAAGDNAAEADVPLPQTTPTVTGDVAMA